MPIPNNESLKYLQMLQNQVFPAKASDVVLNKSYGNYPTYTDGMEAGTDQCAMFSNQQMRDLGFDVWGNAWALNTTSGPGLVLNGYQDLPRPNTFNRNALIKYNHLAADNFKKQFDASKLNKNAQYAVNMFFNGQPRTAERAAYEDGYNVAGTHTGMLRYNNETHKWELIHNIHNRVYVEPIENALGSTNEADKWGITALYNIGTFDKNVPQEDINVAYNAGNIKNSVDIPFLPVSYYQDGGELISTIVQTPYNNDNLKFDRTLKRIK